MKISGYSNLTSNDVDSLKNTLVNYGPVVVLVDMMRLLFYSGGIFDSCKYDTNMDLNHFVLLIGYGSSTENGKE